MPPLNQFPISGSVAQGFEPVRLAFEANFTRRSEVIEVDTTDFASLRYESILA